MQKERLGLTRWVLILVGLVIESQAKIRSHGLTIALTAKTTV